MKQRTTEWLVTVDTEYHERQFQTPYRSTVLFCDWLESINLLRQDSTLRILDIGCGMGANTAYIARRYPRSEFIGLDINAELLERGNEYIRKLGIDNCRLQYGDLYTLDSVGFDSKADAVVSFQTLSWLPEAKVPLQKISSIAPRWIGLTSLFYDGPVECTVQTRDYSGAVSGAECREAYYNVYSLPNVAKLMASFGYSEFESHRFDIDVDLAEPSHKGMGTYTVRAEGGRRLQISGPLLMPWYFIAAMRNDG